jgi:hypothetical protein
MKLHTCAVDVQSAAQLRRYFTSSDAGDRDGASNSDSESCLSLDTTPRTLRSPPLAL